MGTYFSLDYDGGPFVLFGLSHWVAMLVAAVIGGVLLHAGRGADEPTRIRMRRVLGAFLLIDETLFHVWAVSQGAWSVADTLPFNMCSAMAWTSGFALLFDARRVYPYVYFFGVAGAVQGVLQPDAGANGFPHYRFIETMASHSAIVIAGLWVVIVERARPVGRHFWYVMGGLNVYAFVMYFVNQALGSNYLYVNAKPPTASIVDLMPDWPWYIAVLEIVALVLFGLLYLPFLRRKPVSPTASS